MYEECLFTPGAAVLLCRHMQKALLGLLISLGFLVPVFASASATITQATLNGASSVTVSPGANISVALTATLTDSTKWKGISWGINHGAFTTTCVNTKNAKEGTRNNQTGVFTETFTIKAPGVSGVYNADFLADEANNCGKPLGSVFSMLNAIRVVDNSIKPVISAHSDISVQLVSPAAGSVVTYVNPPAIDQFGGLVAVSCAPASGYFFPIGNTIVTCSATDIWGSTAIPSSFVVSVLAPVVSTDTQAPVIAPHGDVLATTTAISTAVSYTLPTATDNVDPSVNVSCAPASDSVFGLGATTVTCTAQDAAANAASSTFNVVVIQVPPTGPTEYVMKSQPDESYLCGAFNHTWQYCDELGTFGFTDDPDSGVRTINLEQGSTLGDGMLKTVTIANTPVDTFHPWTIGITCFNDAGYTDPCGDWAALSETAHSSSDNVHWTADFSAAGAAFIPERYYRMVIDDRTAGIDWPAPVYGSQSLKEPFWVIKGLH